MASSIRPEDWEGAEALREPSANGSSAAAMAARIEGLRIRLTKLAPAGGGDGGGGAVSDGVSVSLGDLLRLPVEVRAGTHLFRQTHLLGTLLSWDALSLAQRACP